MTIHNFTLDRSIFNNDLYSRINGLWFHGVPEDAAAAPKPAMKRWFGMGSPDEKAAFDQACVAQAQEALQSIGPEKLQLPAFKSHEEERQNAQELSKPLLGEVEQAQGKSEKESADTLLSLIVLLDQMPRNMFRDHDTLPKVYNHYDRLALALLRSSMQLRPSPTEYRPYSMRPVIQMWYLMPLMHTEDLSAHDVWLEQMKSLHARMEAAGDHEAAASMSADFKSAEQHALPLRKFGRYPHRNECLGRQSTPEEVKFLETAVTFGVKQSGKQNATQKDEL